MKKLIAVITAAALLLTLASCAGDETESTAAETTGAAATEPTETTGAEETTAEAEATTEEVTTEEVTTEEETTTAEQTTAQETTTAETTAAETTKAEETTTAEVTTAEETQPIAGERYEFDEIYVTKPAGYTFKEFSGLPSGLKNGIPDGNCFFNFATADAVEPMTEDSVPATIEFNKTLLPNFGECTLDGFKSYEVGGHTVTKLDYTWEIGISQSLVRVHFDDHVVVIQFATLVTIPEGVTEFDAMIDSLGIK